MQIYIYVGIFMAFYGYLSSFTVQFKYAVLDNTDDENDASSIAKTKLKATSETERTIDSNKSSSANIDPNIEEYGHVDHYVAVQSKIFTTQWPLMYS